ncbi:ABC transporter permease [Paenibacillus humicola]|uniref:ABC transporter permease n=1 Tax=Paenibacillus humicola TaxID=3110540 RepID=UPI00237ABD8C|nr:ABC transporter permease [Paenibacillus humicola]
MNGQPAGFKSLVRHEAAWKSTWRKRENVVVTEKWRFIYAALLLLAGLCAATYFAFRSQLNMNVIWFATMGIPYVTAFFGVGIVRREIENNTHGWWLTLPYPRLTLIGAKWAAAILQALAVFAALFAAGFLYTSAIAIALPSYTFADVANFMTVGFNWLGLIAGFSPFAIALGLLSSSLQITMWRPLAPIVWTVLFLACSTYYWGFNAFFPAQNIFTQFTAERVVFFPFPWTVPVCMAASWVAGYLIVRLTALLLDTKLDL